MSIFVFFNDTATTEIYTLSLHDALPIWFPCPKNTAGMVVIVAPGSPIHPRARRAKSEGEHPAEPGDRALRANGRVGQRSEEHTSELQSRQYLVCRLLLEKKKYHPHSTPT